MAQLAEKRCAPARSASPPRAPSTIARSTGDFTPTLTAGEDELTAIAEAMHGEGRSVLQFVLDLSTTP